MPTLSHKIRFYPTMDQEKLLVKSCGCARFAWNWALAKYQELKANGVAKVNMNDIKASFNAIKRQDYPWIYDCPKDANQQPFSFLRSAIARYYKIPSTGFPKFKCKGVDDSFYISNDKFWIRDVTCKLPVIGKIRLAEPLRFTGKILSGTVSRSANSWYISVTVELPNYSRVAECHTVSTVTGIDVGLKTFATLSNGDVYNAPRPARYYKKKLKLYQRRVSRKQLGSKNRTKAVAKVAKLNTHIANIRLDFLHKATTDILRRSEVIVIEDLRVSNMMKNHKLAGAISDVSFYEFRRQLEYKAPLFNRTIIIADKWFASSKICSCCGNKKTNLTLSDRVYRCMSCGIELDRDLNAALNLKQYYVNTVPTASGDLTPVEIDASEVDSRFTIELPIVEPGILSEHSCSS